MRTGLKAVVPFIVLLVASSSPAHSQDAWRVLLEQQLLNQEKCRLNYLTDVSATEETGGVAVKARAHCEDTRSFDVSLQPGKSEFEVSACKPTYC